MGGGGGIPYEGDPPKPMGPCQSPVRHSGGSRRMGGYHREGCDTLSRNELDSTKV